MNLCQQSAGYGGDIRSLAINSIYSNSYDFNCQINPLIPGTLYHYRAIATNPVGSGYGSDKTFLTKPENMTGFHASAFSSKKISLNWNNGAGGDGAYIEYTTGSPPNPWDLGSGIKIDADGYVPGSKYRHSNLNPGTRYYYKAWAYAEDKGVKSDGTDIYPFGNTLESNAITYDALVADSQGPYKGVPNEPINFTGSATGGVPPYSWFWDFGDENTSTLQNPSHTYAEEGKYTVTLTVTDNVYETDHNSTTAEIIDELLVSANGPYGAYINSAIQFNGTASGGTPPYSWFWNFGDGNTSVLQNPSHTYAEEGNYTVFLNVKDSANASHNDTTYAEILNPYTPMIIVDKITGGFGIQAVIKNVGTGPAHLVPWSIEIKNARIILLGAHVEGEIYVLGPGEFRIIDHKALFAIGKDVMITVSAGSDAKQATASWILGPLVIPRELKIT
jgi:PKD repeat protein